MPVAKPAYWSPVAPLSGIRQFFSRNLVKFTPCLTPPRIYPKSNKAKWSFHSTRLTMNFFTSTGDFRQVHGHHQWMNGQEMLAMGSPVIEDLAEWVPRTCTVWQRTFFGTPEDRDFLQLDHQSSSAGHAIVWSIVFLFDERNFRLCVNRNFDTIFDPVLPEPNRIFGLLNLSINTHTDTQTHTQTHRHRHTDTHTCARTHIHTWKETTTSKDNHRSSSQLDPPPLVDDLPWTSAPPQHLLHQSRQCLTVCLPLAHLRWRGCSWTARDDERCLASECHLDRLRLTSTRHWVSISPSIVEIWRTGGLSHEGQGYAGLCSPEERGEQERFAKKSSCFFFFCFYSSSVSADECGQAYYQTLHIGGSRLSSSVSEIWRFLWHTFKTW